jgi:DNA-directed RNA polymerase specialized sigma24 family protein
MPQSASKLDGERKTLGFPVGDCFNVLLQANPEVVKEMMNMDSSALLEVLNEFGFVSKEELAAEREADRRKLEAEKEEARRKLESEREDARRKLEAEREADRRKLEAEKEEARRKTVGKMKSKGFSPDEISDLLDVPLETVREYFYEEEARRRLEADRKKSVEKMKGKGFPAEEISDLLDMPLETVREYFNGQADGQ